jgi:hypothetical protein
MVAMPVIPRTWEAEAGRLKVWGQPGLHCVSPCLKKKFFLPSYVCFWGWWYWGLNLGQALYHLSHASGPFFTFIFKGVTASFACLASNL